MSINAKARLWINLIKNTRGSPRICLLFSTFLRRNEALPAENLKERRGKLFLLPRPKRVDDARDPNVRFSPDSSRASRASHHRSFRSKKVRAKCIITAPEITCSELRIWSDFAEAKIAP